MFLNDILQSLKRKQINHLRNVKHKEDFDLDKFLMENVKIF